VSCKIYEKKFRKKMLTTSTKDHRVIMRIFLKRTKSSTLQVCLNISKTILGMNRNFDSIALTKQARAILRLLFGKKNKSFCSSVS
jgi:hypothetical protein